jgi:hypothetical protein
MKIMFQSVIIFLTLLLGTRLDAHNRDSISTEEYHVWEYVLARYKSLPHYNLSNLTLKADSVRALPEIDSILLARFHAHNAQRQQIPAAFIGFQWFKHFDFYGHKLYDQQSVILDSLVKIRNKKNDFLKRLIEARWRAEVQQGKMFNPNTPQIHISRVGFDTATSSALVSIRVLEEQALLINVCDWGNPRTAKSNPQNKKTTRIINGYNRLFLLQKRLGIWQILGQWRTDVVVSD